MQCPKCGTETAEGRKFCGACGMLMVGHAANSTPIRESAAQTLVAFPCPNCGETLTHGRAFCGRCGSRVTPLQQTRVPGTPISPTQLSVTSPRNPINWRKIVLVIGVPAVLLCLGVTGWYFLPRTPLPPVKIGTILDRASAGDFVGFNDGARGRQSLLLISWNTVLEIPSGKMVYRAPLPVPTISPDGQTAITDGSLIDTRSNRRVSLETRATDFKFSNDGSTVAAAGSNGSLDLMESATGKVARGLRQGGPLTSSSDPFNQTCYVTSLAFSPDGKQLASGELNGNITLWNVQTGDLIATLSSPDQEPCDGTTPQKLDPNNEVLAVSFSPDGRMLAAVHNYATVRVWQLSSHTLAYSLPFLLIAEKMQVGFSPDGRFLVTSGIYSSRGKSSEMYLIWNAATHDLVQAMSSQGEGTFEFASDGTLITAQVFGGRVKVESWALPLKIRMPYSSPPVAHGITDPLLLEAYEEQALLHLNYLQGRFGTYSANHGGFPRTIEDTATEAETRELDSENRGYRYTYTPGGVDEQGKITSYLVSARPLLYEQSGTKSFQVNESGQVRATSAAHEASSSDPILRNVSNAAQVAQSAAVSAISTGTPQAPQVGGVSAATPSGSVSQSTAEAEQWVARAESQFQQADYQGAIQSCDAALRTEPGNAKAAQLKAKIGETMRILGRN